MGGGGGGRARIQPCLSDSKVHTPSQHHLPVEIELHRDGDLAPGESRVPSPSIAPTDRRVNCVSEDGEEATVALKSYPTPLSHPHHNCVLHLAFHQS